MISLKELANKVEQIEIGLMVAERIGSDSDRPEGTQTIRMSDTLAKEIAGTLKAFRERAMHER